MTSALFLIVGIACFVGVRIKNKSDSVFFNLADGIWSEFIGDGIQSVISSIVGKIKKLSTDKRINEYIEYLNFEGNLNTYTELIREIKDEHQKKVVKKKIWKPIDKITTLFKKITEKNRNKNVLDAKLIAELSSTILFELDYEEYLSQFCKFKELSKDEQGSFIWLVKVCVRYYREEYVSKTADEHRILAEIIVSSLKDYIDFALANNTVALSVDIEKELQSIKALFVNLAQNYGGLNLQQITNSRYDLKYMLMQCPQCGYNGERIIFNEKTAYYECAACKAKFSFLKTDPDLLEKLYNAADEHFASCEEANKELISLVKEGNSTLREGLEQAVTKTYLEELINAQTDDSKANMDAVVQKAFHNFQRELGLSKETDKKEIISVITELNTANKKNAEYLSQQLGSIDKQISSLHVYAKDQFGDLGNKTDLILQYVKKLYAKEYFDNKTNALGSDFSKAIVNELQTEFQNIPALNAEGIAQIISAIDNLKENSIRNENVDSDYLIKTINDETVILSGQIKGLQKLIESCNEKNKEAFRTIIQKLDDIRAMQLGASTVEGFENIYLGKVPDKYLLDGGFPNHSFPCIYCGVDEIHFSNASQVCECTVCKNTYKKISPFVLPEVIEKGYVKATDDNVVLEKEIAQWRTDRTATIEDNCLKRKENTNYEFCILPENVTKECYLNDALKGNVQIISVPSNVKCLNKNFFRGCFALKTIIFQVDKSGNCDFEDSTIQVENNIIKIYGKNKYGVRIQGEIN